MEELTSAPEAPETPTPADSAPAPAPEAPPADTAEAQEQSYDDDLRKIYRNANRERDESGKFASKEPKPESSPAEEAQPEAPKTEEQPVVAAIPAPNSWNAEAKAYWNKLPPDAQAYVAQREAEVHKAISNLGQYAQRMEPIGKVLNEHIDRISSKGVDPATYVSNVMRADAWLQRDPVGALKALAESYQVDLSALADPFALPADPHQQQISAQLQAAMNEIDTLKRQIADTSYRVQGREAQEYQARQSAIEREIDEFAADKPDFGVLFNDLEILLPQIRKSNPNLGTKEALKEAYERARWSNPTTRTKILEEQKDKAEKARLDEAKKAAFGAKRAAAINVNGSVPQRIAQSIDDDLRSIWRKNHAT